MKLTTVISNYLYSALRGVYEDGAVLYLGRAQVEMSEIAISGAVEGNTMTPSGYIITGNDVYPICTKEAVPGKYIIYDSIEVRYGVTKDGQEPENVTARVLCVAKTYKAAEELCDSVEERLRGAYISAINSNITILTRRSDYDDGVKEFIEELTIKVEL